MCKREREREKKEELRIIQAVSCLACYQLCNPSLYQGPCSIGRCGRYRQSCSCLGSPPDDGENSDDTSPRRRIFSSWFFLMRTMTTAMTIIRQQQNGGARDKDDSETPVLTIVEVNDRTG